MNGYHQHGNADVSKSHFRRSLTWLFRLMVLSVGLMLVGAVYESLSENSDTRTYPPPGRMVNVGGYRLHINCTGKGSPTVVIEAGWGDSSASWSWVQPEVAKTTRICTYDRAGMGWSEVSPQPRTAREFAIELHALLVKANELGPFVLVGHSLGGYTMRVYAHDYPAEVSGLVLIDPQALPKSDSAAFKTAPKPGGIFLPVLLARIGVVRLLAGPLGAIQNLPAGAKEASAASAVTPRFVQTFLDEGMGMSEGGAQAKAVTTLGALPLIVLSRGQDQDMDWHASQAGFLQLSTKSQQLFAERSGHRIMIDQPEAAVASIVKMLELVRQDKQELP
jgi:pimeloyl-ACP methyl ester carboxylesterase